VIHPPFFLETFGYAQYQKLEIEDFPYLSKYFPDHKRINLVDDLLINDTQNAYLKLQNLSCAVVMSYHLALYLYFLKVPVYLLSYNEYYQHKQRSLGQVRTLGRDYFKEDDILSRQEKWLENNQKLRQEWLVTLNNFII